MMKIVFSCSPRVDGEEEHSSLSEVSGFGFAFWTNILNCEYDKLLKVLRSSSKQIVVAKYSARASSQDNRCSLKN